MSYSFMIFTNLVHFKHGQTNITCTISLKKMLNINTCTIGKYKWRHLNEISVVSSIQSRKVPVLNTNKVEINY